MIAKCHAYFIQDIILCKNFRICNNLIRGTKFFGYFDWVRLFIKYFILLSGHLFLVYMLFFILDPVFNNCY